MQEHQKTRKIEQISRSINLELEYESLNLASVPLVTQRSG